MADKKMPAARPMAGMVFDGHRIRNLVRAGLVDRGVDPAEAARVVGQLGDGTILHWLLVHGPDIVKLVLALLPLFVAPAPPPAE